MSVTHDQQSKLRSCHSLDIFVEELNLVFLNERTFLFGKCFRDTNVQTFLQQSKLLQALLEVLTFGSYSDYQLLTEEPALVSNGFGGLCQDVIMQKMKVLTFMSLSSDAVSKGCSRVSYELVAGATGMGRGDVRGVEDLVLCAMSLDLVDCRMNQRERFIEIISAQPREVMLPNDVLVFVKRPRDDIQFMLERLTAWLGRSKSASGDVCLVSQAVDARAAEKAAMEGDRARLAAARFQEEVAVEKARRNRSRGEVVTDRRR